MTMVIISQRILFFLEIKKTDEIIKVGIFNFKKHTKDLEDLKLKLPVKINLSTIIQQNIWTIYPKTKKKINRL